MKKKPGKFDEIREQLELLPGWPWLWLAGLGVVLLLGFFVIRSCTASRRWHQPTAADIPPGVVFTEDNNGPPATPPKVPAAKKQPVSAPRPKAPVATAPVAPIPVAAAAAFVPAPVSGAPPPPPGILNDWSDNDFLHARTLNDSRLVTAVEHRTKSAQRTASEAEMLASLVKPAKVMTSGSAGTAMAPAPLIRAVASALAANNTDAARDTLTQLLGGDIPVADRGAAVEGSAAALLCLGSPESEQIVMKYLIPPPVEGQAPVAQPPGILAAVRSSASPHFRKLLARTLIEGAVPAAERGPILQLLCESSKENLEAQTLIYQSELADAPTRTKLENEFVGHSRGTLQTFLGFSARHSDAAPAVTEWQYRVGGQLWSSPLTDYLAMEHQNLLTLKAGAGIVCLVATIPSDSARIKLRRTLSRHWPEGPEVFHSSDMRTAVFVEPGFLPLIKSLLRENAEQKPQPPPKLDRNHRHAAPNHNGGAAHDWQQLVMDVVHGYGDGCRWRALANKAYKAAGNAAYDDRPTNSPVQPHPHSRIDVAYCVDWPGKQVANLPQLADDAMQLNYARIEDRNTPTKLVAYYSRQLKHCWTHYLKEGVEVNSPTSGDHLQTTGWWLDSFSEGPNDDRAKSIDVWISPASAASTASPDEEQELTVEILSIEVRKLRE